MNVKEEQWYKDPFGWYVENHKPEIYGVQMTEVVALDFLQGLHDVYLNLKKYDRDQAIRDAEILATLLIASALRVGKETMEELLIEEFNDIDVDGEYVKLLEGNDDDKG